jgi:hypothetical protein
MTPASAAVRRTQPRGLRGGCVTAFSIQASGGEVSEDFHGETVVADGGAWLGASARYLG